MSNAISNPGSVNPAESSSLSLSLKPEEAVADQAGGLDRVISGLHTHTTSLEWLRTCHFQDLITLSVVNENLFKRSTYYFVNISGGVNLCGNDEVLKTNTKSFESELERCYQRAVNNTLKSEEPGLAAAAFLAAIEVETGYNTGSCFMKVSNRGLH